MTYRITAPHFCAGLTLGHGRIEETAPILAYMRGWSIERVRDYCDRKGWTVEALESGG